MVCLVIIDSRTVRRFRVSIDHWADIGREAVLGRRLSSRSLES